MLCESKYFQNDSICLKRTLQISATGSKTFIYGFCRTPRRLRRLQVDTNQNRRISHAPMKCSQYHWFYILQERYIKYSVSRTVSNQGYWLHFKCSKLDHLKCSQYPWFMQVIKTAYFWYPFGTVITKKARISHHDFQGYRISLVFTFWKKTFLSNGFSDRVYTWFWHSAKTAYFECREYPEFGLDEKMMPKYFENVFFFEKSINVYLGRGFKSRQKNTQ